MLFIVQTTQADVQYWKDSIINEIDATRALISSIPNRQDRLERRKIIEQADKNIRNAKANCRSFKAEIRIIADPGESSRYRNELANFEKTLSKLNGDLQSYKSEESRSQLFLNANSSGNGKFDEENPTKGGDQLLDEADNLQDKTRQSLTNTRFMVDESKNTGSITLEELRRQREQLNTVDEHVNTITDELVRADKLIKAFGKRMATDKLIQCFACVNILLIVGVVVYAVVKGGLPGNNESNAPENPLDQN